MSQSVFYQYSFLEFSFLLKLLFFSHLCKQQQYNYQEWVSPKHTCNTSNPSQLLNNSYSIRSERLKQSSWHTCILNDSFYELCKGSLNCCLLLAIWPHVIFMPGRLLPTAPQSAGEIKSIKRFLELFFSQASGNLTSPKQRLSSDLKCQSVKRTPLKRCQSVGKVLAKLNRLLESR